MDGRCKTCKWWDGRGDYNHGRCESPKLTDTASIYEPDQFAVYESQDGRTAFVTGRDFGCVHWEAK